MTSQFLFYFALGFRFSAKVKSGFRICYSIQFGVFFRFSSENMRLNDLNRVHVFSDFACDFRFWSKFISVFYDYLYRFAVFYIIQCPRPLLSVRTRRSYISVDLSRKQTIKTSAKLSSWNVPAIHDTRACTWSSEFWKSFLSAFLKPKSLPGCFRVSCDD